MCLVIFIFVFPAFTVSLHAQPDSANIADTLDHVWMLIAGALVFFMQAGFALLESGITRAKNAINVIMKNYTDVCFGSIAYWAIGFGIMFGTNTTGWFGTNNFFPVTFSDNNLGFLFFQTMFAATAATIVSGAVAERTRYWSYLISSVVVTAIVYSVFGSWAWGGYFGGQGWLAQRGFIDYAGSTVVHSVGGWCALAAIIVLGPRLGKFDENRKPRNILGHNLPLIALGGFILWLGWFGFNGGSGAATAGLTGRVLLNTHLAACAGVVGGMLYMVASGNPVLMTNTVFASIGGLVAITAGCATMGPHYAIVTGIIAGIISVSGVNLMERFKLDDVVGAVPVHGFSGAWGTLAAGLFKAGDMFNLDVVITQLIGIVAAFVWVFPVSLILYVFINIVFRLRATTAHELKGLDFTEHYEIGYPEFLEVYLQGGKDEGQ